MVTPRPTTREADVTDDRADSSTRNQDAFALGPYTIELAEEVFVSFDVSQLTFGLGVFLEVSIRWRCDDQVNRLVW